MPVCTLVRIKVRVVVFAVGWTDNTSIPFTKSLIKDKRYTGYIQLRRKLVSPDFSIVPFLPVRSPIDSKDLDKLVTTDYNCTAEGVTTKFPTAFF